MKHIFLNLKRFDVPAKYGGVNRIAEVKDWAASIVNGTQDALRQYGDRDVEFVMFFPEAHIIGAAEALSPGSPVRIGCQGVCGEDVRPGGNFGALTTCRPAVAMKAAGCTAALIGHCEERRDKAGILAETGVSDAGAVNRLMNREVAAARQAGLSVLYCVGESAEEQDRWQEVLREQLTTGLAGADRSGICIAYEPVWAIGPGKVPPDREYIAKTGAYIKEVTGGMDVVYGGGLKADNAKMLASVPGIDGGLIALTRFSGEIGFYPDEYLEIIRTYMAQ